MCSTTGVEAWNTAGAGAMCSTTHSGDETPPLALALLGASLNDPSKHEYTSRFCALAILSQNGHGVLLLLCVVVVFVFDADVHNVHVHIVTHAPQQLATSHKTSTDLETRDSATTEGQLPNPFPRKETVLMQ